MRNLLLILFIVLIHTTGFSQIKIDRNGFHLGEFKSFIVNIEGKTKQEIYKSLSRALETKKTKIISKTENEYIKIKLFDTRMFYFYHSGPDGYIGSVSEIEFQIKDGKFRILEFQPNLYYIPRRAKHIDNPENIDIKKPFYIMEEAKYTIYLPNEGKIKRSSRKNRVKDNLEDYFNKWISDLSNKILITTNPEKW